MPGAGAPGAGAPEQDEDLRWAVRAAQVLDDKQGTQTVVLDVGNVLAITGAFVVTSAPNTRLVRTLAEEVERVLKLEGGPAPRRVEGLGELSWVLLDYGGFVVHVFLEDSRRFYDIERLYRDVPVVGWQAASA